MTYARSPPSCAACPRITAGQTTYDLRRLKSRGLITRIAHTHRYRVTDHGLHTAHFLTCIHDRVLLRPPSHKFAGPSTTGKLRAAATAYHQAIDGIVHNAGFTA